jgi:hypothetical protein
MVCGGVVSWNEICAGTALFPKKRKISFTFFAFLSSEELTPSVQPKLS